MVSLPSVLIPVEEADFNFLLTNDTEFQKEFLIISEKLTPQKLEVLPIYKDGDEWENVTSKFVRTPFIEQIGQYKVALVSLAAILIGFAFWLLYNPVDKSNAANIAETLPQVIQLKLSNGDTIDLSSVKGEINTPSATITNADKTLTYNVRNKSKSGINTLTVAPGMDYHLILSDGTEIWLKATTTEILEKSRLRCRY
jgi:transmembrane sensor